MSSLLGGAAAAARRLHSGVSWEALAAHRVTCYERRSERIRSVCCTQGEPRVSLATDER
jgi:hypothetical protein